MSLPAAAESPPRNALPLTRRLVSYRFGLFVLSCVLWGVIHSTPVLYGLLIKALFDALAAGEAAVASPWTLLALTLAVDAGRLGVLVGGVIAWSNYWIEITLLMRRNILEYLLTAPGSRRLPDSPGEIVSRFRDDVNDIAEYVENWIDFWGLAALALGALVVMLLIAPLLTVLVCVPLLLAFLLTGLLRPRIRAIRRVMRETTGRVTDFIGQMSGGVQALKVAGAQEQALAHFEALNERRRKAALSDTLLAELFRSVTDNMVHIATGIILLLAAGGLSSGTFTVGDFALFVSYLPRLTWVMSLLGAMLVQHRRTGVAFERLEKVMQDGDARIVVATRPLPLAEEERPFREERAPHEPLRSLRVEDLAYRHPDGTVGVEGVSFELAPGSFTVVVGPVGAGKTTLLRVLLGLLPRSSGRILWNGVEVNDPASFLVPPRSAYTPQVPRLFSDSLRENLVLGGSPEPDEVALALRLAVLEEDIAALDAGLDTPVGSRGVKLSGGQAQRAAAARTFLRRADLLVFDDLSSALDVETELALWERLYRWRQSTCLVVSHRPAAIARADTIIIMDSGRVRAIGKPDEVAPLLADILRPGREGSRSPFDLLEESAGAAS